MTSELAFDICYHLEDPRASYENLEEEVDVQEQIHWILRKCEIEEKRIDNDMTGLHVQLQGADQVVER